MNPDPNVVIARLSQQIGQLSAELAVTSATLDAARARVAELEEEASGAVASGTSPDA